MLKQRIPMLEQRLPMVKTTRTLKDKQQSNGRTLALDGAAWRRIRAYVLSSEPLCRHCTTKGFIRPATDVDHINNNPRDNRIEALQPLCKSCHSIKTMQEMRGKTFEPSFDVDGVPLDPMHPWRIAATAENR